MRLRLQPDTDVLDRARQRRVGNTGKGAGQVVLAIGEGRSGAGGGSGEGVGAGQGVLPLEVAAGVVEAAELDGDAGANSDKGREGAFVEGGGAFVLEDRGRAGEGVGVGCCGLEADFNYVWVGVRGLSCGRLRRAMRTEGLTWIMLVWNGHNSFRERHPSLWWQVSWKTSFRHRRKYVGYRKVQECMKDDSEQSEWS